MNDNIVYVPMLKTKRGEFASIEQLSDSIKDYIKPLFTLTLEDAEKRALTLSSEISKRWGNRPFYIDLNRSNPYITIKSQSIFDHVLSALNTEKLDYTPIIDAHNPESDIINHIVSVGTSACIRVDINTFNNQTISSINAIINALNLNNKKIDILIDYQSDTKADRSAQAFDISTYYNLIYTNFHMVVDHIILGGSSIPKELPRKDYSPHGTNPRIFWQGYSEFITNNKLERLPIFADYSIVYPHEPEHLDFMNPNSKIRYSFGDQYLFVVGETIRDEGHEQNHDLADQLINSGHFMGGNYSWGDNYIVNCAAKSVSCGNMETWIRVGHNHHITLAAKQNANLHGISI